MSGVRSSVVAVVVVVVYAGTEIEINIYEEDCIRRDMQNL